MLLLIFLLFIAGGGEVAFWKDFDYVIIKFT